MPINWFVVFAQIINFLILVWLLKRFLYKPILDAIDAREKGIVDELAAAAAKNTAAQQERDAFLHKNEVFDQERAALLKKVTDEANAERQRLLDEVHKEVETVRARRQAALRSEQQALNRNLIRWTQKEVFAIARRTLADLASSSLEERIVELFVDRFRALTGPAREQLSAAMKTAMQPARVRSAFDLLPTQRSLIEASLQQMVPDFTSIVFETMPDLVCGIELSIHGQKISWNIVDYLATVEKRASELIDAEAKADGPFIDHCASGATISAPLSPWGREVRGEGN